MTNELISNIRILNSFLPQNDFRATTLVHIQKFLESNTNCDINYIKHQTYLLDETNVSSEKSFSFYHVNTPTAFALVCKDKLSIITNKEIYKILNDYFDSLTRNLSISSFSN